MQRKKREHAAGGYDSVISASKDLFNTRISIVPEAVSTVSRFKGKLGAAMGTITAMIVGFLTLPNNILYLIDNNYSTRMTTRTLSAPALTSPDPGTHIRPDYEYAYIYGGVFLALVGMLSLVVSIVLSYFAAKSKVKVDNHLGSHGTYSKSTRTVLACLVMMNVELFMSIIAGCMEFLYRPLARDVVRLHSVESTIAVFNIMVYILYVCTVAMTSTVLKGKHELDQHSSNPAVEGFSVPLGRNSTSYKSQSRYL